MAPEWTASEPTPPAPETTSTVSPGSTWAQVVYRCQAVNPWINSARSGAVVDPVGDREGAIGRDRDALGIAAGAARVSATTRSRVPAIRPAASAPGIRGSDWPATYWS